MVATRTPTGRHRNENRLRRSGPGCALSRHPAQAEGSYPHASALSRTGGDTTSLPSSIVCNPLKRRLKLADAEVLAAANAEVATFDRVEVDTGERRFETQGLVYASVRTAGLVDALKAHRGRRRLRVSHLRARCDRRRAWRRGPDRRRRPCRAAASCRTRRRAKRRPAAISLSRSSRREAAERPGLRLPQDARRHHARRHMAAGRRLDRGRRSTEETIQANRLEHANADAILAFCRQHFADALDGVSRRPSKHDARAAGARSSPSAPAAGIPARRC